MKPAARSEAAEICFRDFTASASGDITLSSNPACPWMMVKILLMSCATPAANWPMDSIFWDCRNCASNASRAVMSSTVTTMPSILPPASKSGAAFTESKARFRW